MQSKISHADTQRALAGAFRELTLGLVGLYRQHDVDPELVIATAKVLRAVFHARLSPPADLVEPLRRLLNDLDASR